jgi:hypothetical protein
MTTPAKHLLPLIGEGDVQRDQQISNKRPKTSTTCDKEDKGTENQNQQQKTTLPNPNQQEEPHPCCLVEDVFSIVMSMLAPKEMLCLSQCSKSLTRMVTHESVVRNTIMMGGHPRKSLKALMDLLNDRKIFFPSAMRLLRVACGQRCEMTGCTKTVHTVRSHYGIFCCFQ